MVKNCESHNNGERSINVKPKIERGGKETQPKKNIVFKRNESA